MPAKIFFPEQLRKFAVSIYRTFGLPEEDSELLADSLVQADLWGHQSHGIMRAFWYGKRLQSGATKAITNPALVVDGGAIAVLDGNDGVGQVIAKQAMQEAIGRAKDHGVGVVSVRNSGHFGTAMYFTRMATQEGCIGILSTNASPAMAPWGGKEKMIGTNPWSIAAPAGRHAPMILDIANTVVARGKLYLALKRGEPIPDNWAMDTDGNPTSKAAAGIAGNILPMAGHKGYAIAMMMDVLSGVLSGGCFGGKVTGPYKPDGRSGAGHLAIALDIESFRPLAEFCADMEQLIAEIKNVPLAPDADQIFYPGEREARADLENREIGIAIPQDTLAELDSAAKDIGVEPLGTLKE